MCGIDTVVLRLVLIEFALHQDSILMLRMMNPAKALPQMAHERLNLIVLVIRRADLPYHARPDESAMPSCRAQVQLAPL